MLFHSFLEVVATKGRQVRETAVVAKLLPGRHTLNDTHGDSTAQLLRSLYVTPLKVVKKRRPSLNGLNL